MAEDDFSAVAVAAECFRSIYAVIFWLGTIFIRNNAKNLWERHDDDSVRSCITRMIDDTAGGPAAHPRFVGDVLQAVKDRSFVPFDGRHPPFYLDGRPYVNLAVVRNGILNTQTRALMPHDRLLFNTACCDFNYDPTATCPRITGEFLPWFCCGDEKLIKLNLEIDAFCSVLPCMVAQRYFIMLGDGSNGKQSRLELMTALVGGNVSTVPLEQFGGRFAVSQIIGKAVNIDGDVNEASRIAEGHLKQFCDGSRVQCEEKFKHGRSVILNTRFVFATNKMIRLFGTSNGDYRRPLIVPCNAVVTKRILSYEKQLLPEMSGYFNMVLDAADRLRDRGDFLVHERCKVILNEFRDEFDSARDFCKRCVTYREGSFASSEEMLQSCGHWCCSANRKPVTDHNFWRAFHRVWDAVIAEHKVYATKKTIDEDVREYVRGRMLVRRKTLNVRGWMNLRFTDSSYIDEEEIEQESVAIAVASTPDTVAVPLAIAASDPSTEKQNKKPVDAEADATEVNRLLEELGV